MKPEINSPYAPYIDPKRFGKPDLSRLLIFDTTLRDGEQTPGAAQGPEEKAYLSKFINAIGVDAMEVSFAISDPNEIDATHKVIEALGQHEDSVSNGRDVLIYSLSRALPADVDAAWEAVQSARLPGIHTFVSTSEDHRRAKFPGKRQEDLKYMLADSAAQAAEKFVRAGKYGMVEVSAEDALRTPIELLIEIYNHVASNVRPYMGKVGFTFNIPDTVGIVTHPKKYAEYIRELKRNVSGTENVLWSAHVHNDHGFAVASSMMSIEEGVRQIESTVNGIGERAGNSSLEQIAMIVAHDSEGIYGVHTKLDTTKIFPACVEVAAFTGFHPGRNQPVIGSNTRAHEAGIHQAGQIKGLKQGNAHVYEGVTGDEIGAGGSKFPLGRRSGLNALEYHLALLGYELQRTPTGAWDAQESAIVYDKFVGFAKDQRTVTHKELKALMSKQGFRTEVRLPLEYITHGYLPTQGSNDTTGVVVSLRVNEGPAANYTGQGIGQIEAIVDAMKQAVGMEMELKTYSQHNRNTIGAQGIQSFARTEILLQDRSGRYIWGEGYDRDIVKSAARAFANAINLDLLVTMKESRQHYT